MPGGTNGIQLALAPDPVVVLIDRVQIEQVVVNLVLNAIEAMDRTAAGDRLVTIIAAAEDSQATVSVRDRVSGVDAESADRLFEPFFTTKDKGLGLGLVISRSIVESHKGRLWAEANPDRGMTLHFTLPIPGKIA